jgi:hypothetical protein
MEDTVLYDIKVPIDWVCTYRQIQSLLIDYGVSAIAGCDNVCNNKNKDIIQLWNLFKNAVYVYYREDVDKANRIYDFVVRGLKKYTDVNVGTSTIHVEDSEVEVTCTGDNYKFADTKTSYNFQANDESQLDIQDDGLGQTLYFNIKSQKIVAIGTKEEIFSIGYDFVLDNPEDATWLGYTSANNTLIIRENKSKLRVAKFKLVQYESGNILEGKVTQDVNDYTYRYTINVEPTSIEIPAEGGTKVFTVESYKELVDSEGSVIGDKINVPYNAYSSSIYFKVNGNQVSAEANTEEIRSAAIIVERDEVGVSGNKKIDLYQDSLNKEIRYRLVATVDTNTIDSDGTNPVTLTVESYKETYVNGISQGDRTDIPYTAISDKGLLKNNTSDKTKWYMSANDTTNVRTDSIIVRQMESNKSEIIDIRQNPAQEEISYVFSVDQESLTPPSTGQNVILNIQSYKQYYINGKPTTKTPIGYTGAVVTGNDFITIQEGLPNSITVAPNSGESERSGKILYTQQDNSGKTLEVRINQTGSSITYTYHLTIGENEVPLINTADSKTISVESYRQKYVNGSPEGGRENVDYYLSQTSGNANESQYGGVTASPQGEYIYITSELNQTNETVSIQYDVIQTQSSGTPNVEKLTITKAASTVEDQYFIEARETNFEFEAKPYSNIYFEITHAEHRRVVNGQTVSVEDNLSWEPISNADWIHVGNQNERYIKCDENKIYPNVQERSGTVTVRLVANNSTSVTLNVRQQRATYKTVYDFYVDDADISWEFYPGYDSAEANYRLVKEEVLNKTVINNNGNGEDQTSNYTVGKIKTTISSCGIYCDNWNAELNTHTHKVYVSTTGSNDTEMMYLILKCQSTDGRYSTSIFASWTNYDPTYRTIRSYKHDKSIYDFFYHYVPKELKCIYADLIKIFINAHGDNYKLRKAVYNLNLFQSLIAAYFFEDIKKINLFLECIIGFINNYFKENDIFYEYRLNGIEDNGHVYLDILPCQDKTDVKLELDAKTGHLHEIDKSTNKQAIDFEFENDNLIAVRHGYRKERFGKSNSNCCNS